jgi:ribonuclease HII
MGLHAVPMLENPHAIGIDEVGRGPWAGPVVACAFVFAPDAPLPHFLNDSKKLTPARRAHVLHALESMRDQGACWWAIAEATAQEIDEINILRASFLAMRRALDGLLLTQPQTADLPILVDGKHCGPELPRKAQAIIKGDGTFACIAAASVVAKEWRDRLMQQIAQDFPSYGWEQNAGYGTALHQQALKQHGVTPHHRQSFRPIRELLDA